MRYHSLAPARPLPPPVVLLSNYPYVIKPSLPAAEYAVVTCRGGVNTRAGHSFRICANISSPTAETRPSGPRHAQNVVRNLRVFPEVKLEVASRPGTGGFFFHENSYMKDK